MIKVKKLPKTFYPVSIHVVVADNWEEVNKKYDSKVTNEVCATVLSYNGNLFYVVFIKDQFKLQFICHESTHVISEIYKYIGAKYDVDNDEHYAYLLDWLFEEIYKFVSKHISS